MEITFSSRKLQKVCNSEKEMRARFGKPLAERLQQRLAELKAADTLEDIRRLPSARCHELSQNRKGQLAVDVVHPKRLIFEPDHNPVPHKTDGGLDWSHVTKIRVIEIIDYH
ncbi:killer suppression protein [Candidatus Methylomirabilis sp.]|uniref:type II toxin-antitoxin system RelE/ParE family toxin n=1 Tax=Candidatus Methylomirabilis sp. TaxID=2032687 RepID=UPI002A65E4C2|nr:killer suppression protein [Candidatus Methylomirabilis sp.]